jgi:hypothetical protein
MIDLEEILASLTDPNHLSDGWVRMNEFSDLMSSLKAVEHLITLTNHDIGMWKWVIVSLHSTVQGTAVCILTRSDGSGALKEHLEAKIREFYTTNKNTFSNADEFIEIFSKNELATLPYLLRRLGCSFPKDNVPPEKSADKTLHYLVKLHNWRNLFIHFPPLHWSAPETEFIELTAVVIGFVRNTLTTAKWQRMPLITEDELLPLLDRIDLLLRPHTQRR